MCQNIFFNLEYLPWVNEGIKSFMILLLGFEQVFEAGINQKSLHDSPLIGSMNEPVYLLRPINGVLNYYRRGKREKREHSMPLQNLSLVLDEVSLTVSEVLARVFLLPACC